MAVLEAVVQASLSITDEPLATINLRDLEDHDALKRVGEAWLDRHGDKTLLLVIDQVEEIITKCPDEAERHHFLHLLATLLASQESGPFRLVLILRSDFEPHFRRQPHLLAFWPQANTEGTSSTFYHVKPMTSCRTARRHCQTQRRIGTLL